MHGGGPTVTAGTPVPEVYEKGGEVCMHMIFEGRGMYAYDI